MFQLSVVEPMTMAASTVAAAVTTTTTTTTTTTSVGATNDTDVATALATAHGGCTMT